MSPAPAPLLRLIFVSRASPAALGDIDGVLSDILAEAIPNNRGQDVTGILVFHRGWFICGLEGPAHPVRETYRIIGHDPRHEDP